MKLWGDPRGQSEVIGALFMFMLIIFLIGANQVFLVPDKNAEVEQKHSQAIKKDLVTFRSGLIEAAASNEPRSVDLGIGTTYPTRHIAINPPPVSGNLRVTEAGTYELSRGTELSTVCGTEPTAKYIDYRANYNQLQEALPIHQENTIQYRQGRDNTLQDTGQILIRGNQITIIPIKGDFSHSTSGEVSVDLLPAQMTGGDRIEAEEGSGEVVLTVPSRLDNTTWENEILADEMTDAGGNVKAVADVDGKDAVEIQLRAPDTDSGETPDWYTVRCTAVGVNQEPNVTSVPTIGDGSEENATGGLNPCCNKVSWVSSEPDDANVTATFKNHLSHPVKVTDVRFVYFGENDQGVGPGEGTYQPAQWAEYGDTHYRITGSAKEPAMGDTIEADSTTDFKIEFAESEGGLDDGSDTFTVNAGDWFVMRITFASVDDEDDRFTATYIIPVKSVDDN